MSLESAKELVRTSIVQGGEELTHTMQVYASTLKKSHEENPDGGLYMLKMPLVERRLLIFRNIAYKEVRGVLSKCWTHEAAKARLEEELAVSRSHHASNVKRLIEFYEKDPGLASQTEDVTLKSYEKVWALNRTLEELEEP